MLGGTSMFPLLRSTVVFRGGARPIQANKFKTERIEIYKTKVVKFRFLRTETAFSTFEILNNIAYYEF